MILTKPLISANKQLHKKEPVLVLSFKYHQPVIDKIRALRTYTFSRSLRSWITPFSNKKLSEIQELLKEDAIFKLDNSLFHPIKNEKKAREINDDNKAIIRSFVKYLKGKRYSESTIKTYFTFIADFIDYVQPKPINELKIRDVELFLENVFVPRKYSISSQRQFISALKLFISFNPDCQIDSLTLDRPKKSRILPTVLSQEEIIRLIQVTKNLKHRAIIALLYSSGLRIGELTKLELRDIDIERRQIIVKNGKGRKDRFVVLANAFLPLLQNYLVTYKPSYYFVEGQGSINYTESSIRKFLSTSTKLAKIEKRVTPHTLRHSYATHLLENGVGLRHIQELLGHAKPETTMIYTHVAKKDLLEIQSPLDTILLSLEGKNKQEEKFLLSGNF